MSAASNNSFPPDVIAAALAAEKAYYPYGPFVSVSLAQWALESAYGRAEPSGSDNPFGTKAVAGQAAVYVRNGRVCGIRILSQTALLALAALHRAGISFAGSTL